MAVQKINKMNTAHATLEKNIDSLIKLVKQPAWTKLSTTEQFAQAHSLIASISAQANAYQDLGGTLTAGHQHLIHDEIQDPTAWRNVLNPERAEKTLRSFQQRSSIYQDQAIKHTLGPQAHYQFGHVEAPRQIKTSLDLGGPKAPEKPKTMNVKGKIYDLQPDGTYNPRA